jgi:hypothetical protein
MHNYIDNMTVKIKDLRNGLLATTAGTAGVVAFKEYLNPTVTNILPEMAFLGLGAYLLGKTTLECTKSAFPNLRDKTETNNIKENLKDGVKNVISGVVLPMAVVVTRSATNFLYNTSAKGDFLLNHITETLNNTQMVSITNDVSNILTLTGCFLCVAAVTEHLVKECKNLFKRNDRF